MRSTISTLSALTFLSLNLPTAVADQWFVSQLSTHFMGPNSGLPGATWPPGTGFNSSVTFTVEHQLDSVSESISGSCTASFIEKQPPTGWIDCTSDNTDEVLSWRFTPGSFVSEARFGIDVIGAQTESQAVSSASLSVSSNDLSAADSYLTCLGGAPLTGIHCNTDGQLSSSRTPIAMSVTSD
ncbi:hypothetical protein EJ05DRAFT_219849 [Pseudovirgaria hyperparasitica]|uniref:Ig-like domain-containing protein n=1 Tax=Pseudovirgaria hyperparasitica TaxID=470096 RepID=A0A6A6VUD6_9PEZI|nr:uncharacterized protein EJ05DRAFT_219849 [Pseudovirgaria hyperparasitica]KAF2753509.1 hypothetical protein EJ05DRAFT_219849 [Pseudovirgaria hyperparasitica]